MVIVLEFTFGSSASRSKFNNSKETVEIKAWIRSQIDIYIADHSDLSEDTWVTVLNWENDSNTLIGVYGLEPSLNRHFLHFNSQDCVSEIFGD
jgi:hypothetical protein